LGRVDVDTSPAAGRLVIAQPGMSAECGSAGGSAFDRKLFRGSRPLAFYQARSVGTDDTIAAIALRAVERSVSLGDQFFGIHVVVRLACRDADADRNAEFFAVAAYPHQFNVRSDLLCQHGGIVVLDIRQDHDKLLSAIPRDDVGRPVQHVVNGTRHLTQAVVSRKMSVGVVDLLSRS
jgi:hypothetical protein